MKTIEIKKPISLLWYFNCVVRVVQKLRKELSLSTSHQVWNSILPVFPLYCSLIMEIGEERERTKGSPSSLFIKPVRKEWWSFYRSVWPTFSRIVAEEPTYSLSRQFFQHKVINCWDWVKNLVGGFCSYFGLSKCYT